MEFERGNLVSPVSEVPVVEGEIVTAIRELADRGWGSKAITRELGVARNTVRRYRRHPVVAGQQGRAPRRLTEDVVAAAQTLYTGAAEQNAVVVHRLLRDQGRVIGLRTVQRAVAPVRQAQRAADVATVRVETAPGAQMQIDFGEKRVTIAGTALTMFLLVAVLSYSRRTFVKAFLHERQDAWREGIAAAFVHFGGVVQNVVERISIGNGSVSIDLSYVPSSSEIMAKRQRSRSGPFSAFLHGSGERIRAPVRLLQRG